MTDSNAYKPNAHQQEAIDHTDGPLLVLAGPGTGKTELLSKRTLNILQTKDVEPENILCLTFTEIGAKTMRKRLIGTLGRPAYGIEICTFHSFASKLRQRWPEFFERSAADTLITQLHTAEIIEGMLNALDENDPLYFRPRDINDTTTHPYLKELIGLFGRFEQSGITPDEYRKAISQTRDFLTALQEQFNLGTIAWPSLSGKADAKYAAINEFVDHLHTAIGAMPASLTSPLISTPGVYVPYADLLMAQFNDTDELIDEYGKTGEFGKRRDSLFTKIDGILTPNDLATCDKALSALNLYERYREQLDKEHLFTYQDMILDAIRAIEDSPTFLSLLQDRYRYIQIDEFQDTNGSQMRLIDLITQGMHSPNVMVVGDDDQSIMRFQGASALFLQQFKERYRADSISLTENYRSRPALIDLGQHVVHQIQTRIDSDKTLEATKADVPLQFHSFSYQSKELEYYELAKSIRERIDELGATGASLAEKDIAVIARTNKSLESLIPYLNAFDIPFSYRFTSTIEQLAPMQTLLAMLHAISNFATGHYLFAEQYLPNIVAAPELELPAEHCMETALNAEERGRSMRRTGQVGSAWMETLKRSDNAQLRDLYRSIAEASARCEGGPVRELIFNVAQPLSDYYGRRQMENPLEFVEFNYGIKALLDFVEGEIATGESDPCAKPLRLSDVVERLDRARHLGIPIAVSIPFTQKESVRLTTAHGSKGDEFDFVYLLDADDQSWHASRANKRLIPKNMLFNYQGDEDDDRRLVFVAVTRAKEGLDAYLGSGETVRELADAENVVEENKFDELGDQQALEELAAQGQISWRQKLHMSPDAFVGILKPDIENMRLSASKLNSFVCYVKGCTSSADFLDHNILRLPEAPNAAMDFGSIVHGYFQQYVDSLSKDPDELQALAQRYRRKVEMLDYSDEVVGSYLARFDRVVQVFAPWVEGLIRSNPNIAFDTEQWINTQVDDVPLVGSCDIIAKNEADKTLIVYDYKTGKNKANETPDQAYMRQLCFYRMMLENSTEYEGYRVAGLANVYVEPEPDDDGSVAMSEPVQYRVSDTDVQHVRQLSCAVWERIQQGRFDTSAFESSNLYEECMAANVTKDGKPKKYPDKKMLQDAYEQWLIDEWNIMKS